MEKTPVCSIITLCGGAVAAPTTVICAGLTDVTTIRYLSPAVVTAATRYFYSLLMCSCIFYSWMLVRVCPCMSKFICKDLCSVEKDAWKVNLMVFVLSNYVLFNHVPFIYLGVALIVGLTKIF